MKHRLLRRGVTLPAGLIAAGTSVEATAAALPFPQELVMTTVASAARFAAGAAAAPARVLVTRRRSAQVDVTSKNQTRGIRRSRPFARREWCWSPGGRPSPGTNPRHGWRSSPRTGRPPAAPDAGSPEEVFSQAIEALDRDRIDEFVALMHPEAVKQLRATVTATAEALASQGKATHCSRSSRGPGVSAS